MEFAIKIKIETARCCLPLGKHTRGDKTLDERRTVTEVYPVRPDRFPQANLGNNFDTYSAFKAEMRSLIDEWQKDTTIEVPLMVLRFFLLMSGAGQTIDDSEYFEIGHGKNKTTLRVATHCATCWHYTQNGNSEPVQNYSLAIFWSDSENAGKGFKPHKKVICHEWEYKDPTRDDMLRIATQIINFLDTGKYEDAEHQVDHVSPRPRNTNTNPTEPNLEGMERITFENYERIYPLIEHMLTKESKDFFEEAKKERMLEFYNEDETIKECVDEMFGSMNDDIEDWEKTHKGDDAPTPAPNPEPAPFPDPAPEPTPEPEPDNKAKRVFALSPEVSIMSQLIKLQDKPDDGTAKSKARKILAELQKAIVSRRIRKTSKWVKEVNWAQTSLCNMVNGKVNAKTAVNFEHYNDFVRCACSEEEVTAVYFLRRMADVIGKSDYRSAEKLLNELDKAKMDSSEYDTSIDEMRASLKDFIDGQKQYVVPSPQPLNGLGHISNGGRAISSTAFMATEFHPLHFKGMWADLIGDPTKPFKIMMYGKPGNGKSTLALRFAGYLSKEHHQKVLYVASEEGLTYTLQEKIARLGVANDNLNIVGQMPTAADMTLYDAIFIDSVNNAGLEPADIRAIDKSKSLVLVFQATKDGEFRGSNEYLHDVDTSIKVEDMVATTVKNRFGAGKGQAKVQP